MTRPLPQPQVQVDFLGLQKNASTSDAAAPPQPRLDRRSSFRGISKINPEIVKSVIASASATKSSKTSPSDISFKSPSSSAPGSPPPPPDSQFPLLQPLPTSLSNSAGGRSEKGLETTSMTIFYNGNVSVFDLPKEKAQDKIKLAMEFEGSSSKTDTDLRHSSFNGHAQNILQQLSDGDVPIKRKKSLQRFVEKRNERLISSGTGTATATTPSSSYSNRHLAERPQNQKRSV